MNILHHLQGTLWGHLIWLRGSLPCSIGKVFGHNCHSASLGTKDQGTKDQKDNSNGISGLQFGSSMRIRFA